MLAKIVTSVRNVLIQKKKKKKMKKYKNSTGGINGKLLPDIKILGTSP